MYDPQSQRWLEQDPMGYDAGDSNLYRYVNNAPTNATDPSGLETTWQGEAAKQEWPPSATYLYRDPWVELAQGESKDMAVATVRARIGSIDKEKGTYELSIQFRSDVPAQKVTNPLVKGGELPAGVNLRTETFLRGLPVRGVKSAVTLDANFTPGPIKQPDLEVFPRQTWALPRDLASPANIVWATLPDKKPARPSLATLIFTFRMWSHSGEGSGIIEMNGINTDAQGRPLPMKLPMRPIYLRWSFDLESKTGYMKIEQHGQPFIEAIKKKE